MAVWVLLNSNLFDATLSHLDNFVYGKKLNGPHIIIMWVKQYMYSLYFEANPTFFTVIDSVLQIKKWL